MFLLNLEIKSLSRALRILSLSKLISSNGMSAMSLMKWSGREKWSEKTCLLVSFGALRL